MKNIISKVIIFYYSFYVLNQIVKESYLIQEEHRNLKKIMFKAFIIGIFFAFYIYYRFLVI